MTDSEQSTTASPASSGRKPQWLDRQDQWDKLIPILEQAKEVGYDSETWNQPYKTSPQHRTRLHHWSLGVLGSVRTARGYRRAWGVGLPRCALDYKPLLTTLQHLDLWAHNAPHDEHTAKNEGIDLRVKDTLQYGRVCVPGMGSYSLKSKGKLSGVETWALGKPGRDNFKALTTYQTTELVEKNKKVKRCICQREGCKKKYTSEFLDPNDLTFKPHERVEVVETFVVEKDVTKQWQVPDFNPEHPRWSLWLDYMVQDAVSAIEYLDWLRHRGYEERKYPWGSNHFGAV